MGTPPISPETERRIALLFREAQREAVRRLLRDKCGNNLPFLQNRDEFQMERIRFAVLKLSGGDLEKLAGAARLARQDWRDLLVAAGFASRLDAHEHWLPEGGADF